MEEVIEIWPTPVDGAGTGSVELDTKTDPADAIPILTSHLDAVDWPDCGNHTASIWARSVALAHVVRIISIDRLGNTRTEHFSWRAADRTLEDDSTRSVFIPMDPTQAGRDSLEYLRLIQAAQRGGSPFLLEEDSIYLNHFLDELWASNADRSLLPSANSLHLDNPPPGTRFDPTLLTDCD